MKIRVQCYAGCRGDETPRRLFFGERSIEVIAVIEGKGDSDILALKWGK